MNLISIRISRKKNRHPVLVIENDPDQWLILRSILVQCFPDAELIWKNHSSQALLYLKTASKSPDTTPRLIFLNPFIPSLQDGWELLIQIKSDPYSIKIPVIILSSSEESEDVLKGYALGAAGYVTKQPSHTKMSLKFYILRKYWWEMVKLPNK